jgi:hypothetical protein
MAQLVTIDGKQYQRDELTAAELAYLDDIEYLDWQLTKRHLTLAVVSSIRSRQQQDTASPPDELTNA